MVIMTKAVITFVVNFQFTSWPDYGFCTPDLDLDNNQRNFQFTSWPDYGTPDSALSMLQFLQCVREKQVQHCHQYYPHRRLYIVIIDINQAEMVAVMTPPWLGHPLGPPMVVHCSAGIGRTGGDENYDFHEKANLPSLGLVLLKSYTCRDVLHSGHCH